MMHWRGLVLLLSFIPAGARRSLRIDDSHHGAQQQNNTLANGFEVSSETQETLIPRGFGMGLSHRAGPRGGALNEEWKQHGRAKVALKAASGPEEGQLSPKEIDVAAAAPARSGRLRMMSMYSDSRPTQEYFDFLLGRNQQAESENMPSIIVGDGRIGAMLADFGQRRGFDDIIIRRGDMIPELQAGGQLVRMPIYVCTRNDELDAVLAQTPRERWEDLVFLQDGQLEPFLQRNGLYDTTRAVLWLVAMRKGGKPVDGITSEAPEGLTTVSGKWSGALQMRLGTGGLTSSIVNDRDLRRNMLERLIFLAVFHLVGAVHGGLSIGDVAKRHQEEVCALIRELATFCRFTLSVALKTGLEDRLLDYARRVEFLPTALEDFEWRNGYFYRYSLMAGNRTNAAGFTVEIPDSTPIHTEYLLEARHMGLLSQATLDSVARDLLTRDGAGTA